MYKLNAHNAEDSKVRYACCCCCCCERLNPACAVSDVTMTNESADRNMNEIFLALLQTATNSIFESTARLWRDSNVFFPLQWKVVATHNSCCCAFKSVQVVKPAKSFSILYVIYYVLYKLQRQPTCDALSSLSSVKLGRRLYVTVSHKNRVLGSCLLISNPSHAQYLRTLSWRLRVYTSIWCTRVKPLSCMSTIKLLLSVIKLQL